MEDLGITLSGDNVNPGEAYLADTPVLRPHAGTQPDLFLRWNDIPLAAASVNVVVHLHGFSQEGGAMPLAEKVAGSGLDLSGRKRPTIALLPRGNWLRYTWYDFPALLSGGMDRLVDYGLHRFAQAMGRWTLAMDHFILRPIRGAACRLSTSSPEPGGHPMNSLYSTDSMAGILPRATRCRASKSSTDGSASGWRRSRSAKARCG